MRSNNLINLTVWLVKSIPPLGQMKPEERLGPVTTNLRVESLQGRGSKRVILRTALAKEARLFLDNS
jgi:hypothetical protein